MSKSKGSAFERKIAKAFNDRFSEFIGIELPFGRNLHSGAYFGGKNSHRVAKHDKKDVDVGDITIPMNFRYVIECKHYKTPLSLKQLIEQKSAKLDKWIEQNDIDAKSTNKKSMIIIKYNLVPEFVMIEDDLGGSFAKYKDYYMYSFKYILNKKEELFFNL